MKDIRRVKQVLWISTSLLLLTMVMLTQSCRWQKKSNPSPEKQFLNSLTGKTWRVSTEGGVTLDGLDVTPVYESMEINFYANGTYAAIQANPPVWLAQGIFDVVSKVTGGSAFHITRDGIPTVAELIDGKLRVSFNYQAPFLSGNRAMSVSGDYVFTFVEK